VNPHPYKNLEELKPFQVEDVVDLLRKGRGVLGWDTGMGKSRGCLAAACTLLQRRDIDTVLLVCEQNRLSPAEWEGDITSLTNATWARYHGTRRHKILEGELPQIIATTYETAAADIATRVGGALIDGPLTEALAGRRVLVVYDEMPKLAQHTSNLYQAAEYLIERIRPMVVGLTATPYTRDFESVFNMFSLICPDVLPTREQFEEHCVLHRTRQFNTPVFNEAAVRRYLLEPIGPFLLRRRKTDPAVKNLFPVMRELTRHTRMTPPQAQAYRVMEEYGRQERERTGKDPAGLGSVLRMLASYPEALLAASSALAAKTVEAFGATEITAMRPGKLDMLLALAENAVATGDKTVIFSFFGPTVLPLLARDLKHLGVPVLTYIGAPAMSAKARRDALTTFRSHDGPALLLSSDAGARGINVPEASRVIEYEVGLTHETSTQRRNRVHRLGSPHAEVLCATLIADGTVEQRMAQTMLGRNEDTDLVLGDQFAAAQGFTTAEVRRRSMQVWPKPAVI
jgi:SNF2 family DNA or RNA helicase